MAQSPKCTLFQGFDLPDYVSSPSVGETPPYQTDLVAENHHGHVNEGQEVVLRRPEEKNAELIDNESSQTKIKAHVL
jgi:hypothetical protein